MPIQSAGPTLNIAAFSARLLQQHEVLPRARITAQIIADTLPGSAVNIYTSTTLAGGDVWTVLATVGDAEVTEPTIPLDTGTLGILARELKPLRFEGKTLSREEYAHVNVRRTLHSLTYLPLTHDEVLIGAIEILSFENDLSEAQMNPLSALAEVASAALRGAQIYQEENKKINRKLDIKKNKIKKIKNRIKRELKLK